MKFEELKGKKIRWDLNPQNVVVFDKARSENDLDQMKKKIREQAGFFFYIDVYEPYPRLVIAESDENGGVKHHMIEDPPITKEIMIRAIENFTGDLKMPGCYPIDDEIEEKLMAELDTTRRSDEQI
jgi:hypothetical protein